MQEWTDSSQSHRLSALQAFALSRADTADSTLAIQMMQVTAADCHAAWVQLFTGLCQTKSSVAVLATTGTIPDVAYALRPCN